MSSRTTTRGRDGVRHQKSDTFDDLVAIFSRTPVVVTIAVAAAVWVAAALAVRSIPILGPVAALLVLVAGLGGLIERGRRGRMLSRSRTAEGISCLSWSEFEDLLVELFRKEGYRVEKTANGADGGIDHILRGHGETVYVQAKQWNAWHVPVSVVQRTYGVAVAGRASRAIVVTSGQFTAEARAFAEDAVDGAVALVDGDQLLARLHAQGLADRVVVPGPKPTAPLPTLADHVCPSCGAEMRLRRGRYGRFLGCVRYPSCRGTRQLERR